MNRLARVFFVAALVFFAVFHFMPMPDDFLGFRPVGKGWQVWQELKWMTTNGYCWDSISTGGGIALVSFLTASILALSGPFLIPVIAQSKVILWMVAIVSALSMFGLSGIRFFDEHSPIGIAWSWMAACQISHLLGCLCIRRTRLGSSPGPEIPPDA